MKILVADLETNGLNPNIIWVAGILDYLTDDFTAYTGEDIAEAVIRIADADLVIGHNFIAYDNVVLNDLAGVNADEDRVFDTLLEGRKLLPSMACQKLKEWGDIFGYPKIDYTGGFEEFNPKMIPYCERDCRLTKRVFEFLVSVEKGEV